MTSAKFQTVPISSITINRSDRQRRSLENIQELAQSISKVGLINPPVVDSDRVLVAGERRLTACIQLGWTSIPVQFAQDCSPDELYLIELEENVKRVDLSWRDQCRAATDYHKMKSRLEEGWTQGKTAAALGMTAAEFSNRQIVQVALESDDPLIAGAKEYSVALNIARRKNLRAQQSSVELMGAMLTRPNNPTSFPHEEAELTDEQVADIFTSVPEIHVPYLNLDFNLWAEEYVGPKFNFLHCDFPYGIDAGKHNMGAAAGFGGYEDSEDVYWELLDTLSASMINVIADSAHLMFWFSMDFYHLTKLRLEEMGWAVNPFPLIWFKSDNSGILPDPKRGPRRNYETAFLCSRGDRQIVQAVANVFAAPLIKTIHMSEKNPDMLRHFFRMFVDASTVMLDPTMGSGNAVRVAQSSGAAHVLGLERDAEFFALASAAYIEGLTEGGE